MVRRTIADVYREEGEQRGQILSQQRTLLMLLRQRFGELPPEVEQVIRDTRDLQQLEGWLARVIPATSLADIEIGTGD